MKKKGVEMDISKLKALVFDVDHKVGSFDNVKCILEYAYEHLNEHKEVVEGNEYLYGEIVKFTKKAAIGIMTVDYAESWHIIEAVISVRRFVYALQTWGTLVKTNDLLKKNKLYYVSEMIQSLQFGPYVDTSKSIKEYGLGDIVIDRKGIPHHVEEADKEMTKLYFKIKNKESE